MSPGAVVALSFGVFGAVSFPAVLWLGHRFLDPIALKPLPASQQPERDRRRRRFDRGATLLWWCVVLFVCLRIAQV